MATFLKVYKKIRNNWKKSAFGVIVLSYASSSAKKRYDTNVFMRACCKEAAKYGDELVPITENPRSVTVIMNPAANKRSAKADYEKYCEPLLHLAGISVKLLQTNSEGHARELVNGLPDTEPIVVAGGDGTLSEAITGLLRENEHKISRVVGVLPLGRRNLIGNELFPLSDQLPHVKQLTDATMAIIKNETMPRDIMKIEVLSTDADQIGKPIYAAASLEWGAFRDALARRDKYWFYGGLRDYATYIFNGYKNSLTWNCNGTIKYSPPCKGCINCKTAVSRDKKRTRWLDYIMPKEREITDEFSNVSNVDCATTEMICFKTVDVNMSLNKAEPGEPPHLSLSLGKMKVGYMEFVSEGWRRANKGPPTVNQIIKARTIELYPKSVSREGQERWYAIDNEEYDVKPIKVTVLPHAIRFYCKNN